MFIASKAAMDALREARLFAATKPVAVGKVEAESEAVVKCIIIIMGGVFGWRWLAL